MKKNFIWASLTPNEYDKAIRLWKELQKEDLKENHSARSFSSFNREVYILGLKEYEKKKR